MYNRYCTIKDLERQFSKSDVVFLSDDYYEDKDEKRAILEDYIRSASAKIDKMVKSIDPKDPDIRDICCRLVFYALCRRHRVITPEVQDDYMMAKKELEDYNKNIDLSERVQGYQNNPTYFSFPSKNIVKGGLDIL